MEWEDLKMKLYKEIPCPPIKFDFIEEFDRSENGKEYYEKYPYGRKDILICQMMGVANVFVHTDRYAEVQYWTGVCGDTEITTALEKEAHKEYDKREEFVNKQKEFFKTIE